MILERAGLLKPRIKYGHSGTSEYLAVPGSPMGLHTPFARPQLSHQRLNIERRIIMFLWLASYPRSGNTFCRMLLHRVFGLHSYSIYNRGLGKEDLNKLPTALLVGEAMMDRSIDEMDKAREVCFVKTHELPDDTIYPTLYLARDGRDVLVSYAHFIMNYGAKSGRSVGHPSDGLVTPSTQESFAQVLHDLIHYEASFGGWGPHVRAWMQRDPRPVVVRFEDLTENPLAILRGALAELRLDLTGDLGESIPTFEELHREHPQFFRKGKTGSWQAEMPDELHELFMQKNLDVMEHLGYSK